MLAPVRLAERLRRPARPRGGRLPGRPAGPSSPGGAPLRPRHERARDELDDRHRLVRRPRRAGARPGRRGGRNGHARARARPARRGASAHSHGGVRARQGRDRDRLRASLRLRHRGGALEARRPRRADGRCQRRRRDVAPAWRHPARDRWIGGPRRSNAGGGGSLLLLSLVARGAEWPEGRRGRRRAGGLHRPALAPLARGGNVSRPPLALDPSALGAGAQGADLRADRGDGRGADDLAPRDARRGAELGLPLHLDPGRDLHPLEPARDRLRPGGPRVHGVRRSPLPRPRPRGPDHVRDRRRDRAHGEDPRPPLGLRRLSPRADRQRRLQPAPKRRLRGPARLDLHPLQDPRGRARGDGADRLRAGGGGRLRLAPPRPGDLGGARRAQALRLLEADVLGGARPRRAARQGPRPRASWRKAGSRRRTRCRPRSWSGG